MARPQWIEVGRVRRPHGVHGEVRVAVESDNPDRFRSGSVMHARRPRQGIARPEGSARRRLTVEGVRGGDDLPIVAFKEITAREEAETLTGCVLEVRDVDLPALAEDEFYPFDLVGLEVEDPEGVTVGRVSQVLDYPAHGLLEIAMKTGGTVLVPFVSAAVPSVDSAAGHLVVKREFLEGGER